MNKVIKVFVILMILILIAIAGVEGYLLFLKDKESNEKIDELESRIATLSQNTSVTNSVGNEIEGNTTKRGVDNKKQYEEITPKYDIGDDDWIYNTKDTKRAFNKEKNEKNVGLSITDISKNSDDTYTIKGVVYEKYKLSKDEVKKLEETNKITLYGKEYKTYESEDELELESEDDEMRVIRVKPVKADKNDHVEYMIFEDGTIESTAQSSECFKITDKHMEITVDEDTLILEGSEMAMESGEGSTIKEIYESIDENTEYDDEKGTNAFPALYNFSFEDEKCVIIYSLTYES